MSVQIERLTSPLGLGEGPHWDEKTKTLYFVDIPESTVHRYDPQSNFHTYAKVGEKDVSIILPVENDSNNFLISHGSSLATMTWNNVNNAISDFKIFETVDQYPEMRLNDGKASPSGVLFAGTMDRQRDIYKDEPGKGHLYSLKNKYIKIQLENIGISNGLAWTPNEEIFYYIDSMTRKVEVFDYDKENVEIVNRRTVFDFEKSNICGFPDGMTIDTEGNLWVACYTGSQVIKIDPNNGTLLKSIQLPAPFVTSVAFGGRYLDDLYVTSANGPPTEKELKANPESGCLFKITGTGSKGVPGVPVKL